MREQAQTLYTIRERLRQELGREPVLSELSEASGLTPEEIAQVEIATDTPESLQRETADGLTLEGCWARTPRRRAWWSGSPCGSPSISCRRRSG
ncbi:MAG: sigma-70 domain-containing protein [Dysosmobacter welbionis]